MTKNIFTNFRHKFVIFFGLFLILSFAANTQASQPSDPYSFIKDSGLAATGNNAGYEQTAPGPEVIISQVIQMVLSLLGVIFLAFIIYAGVVWLTAEGDDQKVQKAKDMISESIIGLIIVVAAYAISYFLINFFSANSLS
jgi:hypothetical protein